MLTFVLVDIVESEIQVPRGSFSHSVTLQTYEPESEILACRMTSSKVVSVRVMLIRCLWLSSATFPYVMKENLFALLRSMKPVSRCSNQTTE